MSDLDDRRETAQKIASAPEKYKVCESCGSIVVVKCATCPNCNGYRFDHSPDLVKSQALELAERDPVSVSKEDYE